MTDATQRSFTSVSSSLSIGALAIAASMILPRYTSQEHSFASSSWMGIANRSDRTSKLGLKQNERLVQHPGLSEYFLNKDSLFIYYRRWMPLLNVDPTPPRGLVIVVHGLGEHIGRYCEVAKALNNAGFVVYGLDHQGHGRSEGDRGFVKKFEDFGDDVLALTKLAKREHPRLKCFLLGHSLGGAISIDVLSRAGNEYHAAFLSAPAVRVDPSQVSPPLLALVRVLGNVLPRLPIDGLKLESLCAAPTVVDLYVNDPLVSHSPIQARLGAEILSFQTNLKTVAPKVTLPYMLIHGTKDRIVMSEGSDEFHSLSSTPASKKSYVKIDGGMHETLTGSPVVVTKLVSYFQSML